jgi:hypothetical protein
MAIKTRGRGKKMEKKVNKTIRRKRKYWQD